MVETHVLFGLPAQPVAIAILAATYVAIISERVNRALAALLGAAATLLLGLVDVTGAMRGIDWNTIALLTGMMVVVAIAQRSGMFEAVAIAAAHLVKAQPAALLAMLQLVTAVLSALLDNVTTVLLVVPVTLVLTSQLRLATFPFLVAEIIASNIGGAATLIGDPPNILIGSSAPLSFNQFLQHLTPIAAIILLVQIAVAHVVWGRGLRAAPEDRAFVLAETPRLAVRDWPLLWQSLGVIAAVIAGFVLAHEIGIAPGVAAIAGAVALLLLDSVGVSPPEIARRARHTFSGVDWVTIYFFIGLFVVVTGIERSGLLGLLAQGLLAYTSGSHGLIVVSVLWGSALLSALFDNIPFVATMVPIVREMGPAFGGADGLQPVWWSLALGACLGGNGTLIGASSNLAVAGLAEQAGEPIHFWRYFKVAFPMMLLSIALATLYVWGRYLAH